MIKRSHDWFLLLFERLKSDTGSKTWRNRLRHLARSAQDSLILDQFSVSDQIERIRSSLVHNLLDSVLENKRL